MPPRTRVSPKDFTGQQKAKLQEQHAKEISDRRDELAMMEAAEREGLDIAIVQDGSGTQHRLSAEDVEAVDLDPQWVEIRTNCDVEHATIGYGNDYNFKEGQKYKVPPFVAGWLNELGYLR